MKIRLYYFILILSIFLTNISKSQWIIQQYWPHYIDSYFISGTSIGYAICDNYTIRKTTNGGIHWENLNTNINSNLHDIFFINVNTGWVVGQNGLILFTLNGGTNWTTQNSGVTQYLYAVNFINQTTGFIAAQGGVLKTTNSGLNWVYTAIASVTFKSIKFKDINTGFICGNSGNIYKTTNSGINWNISSAGTTENLNNLTNYELETFYISTHLGKILKTTNAGLNWQIIPTGNNNNIESMEFFNSTTGYFCTFNGQIYKTTNAGLNWLNIFNNSVYSTTSIKLISLTGNDLITLGYNGIILKSTNSGSNWNLISGNPKSDAIAEISFINSLTGFACDYNGLIYKTTNSGSNWNVINDFQDCSFYEIQFINSSTGFVTGDSTEGPVIWKTTNSGIFWQRKDIYTFYSQLNSSYFINDNTGYISVNNFAESGTDIIKTTNGGNNWIVLYKTTFKLNDIYFIDINTGWGCSQGGIIYKTTNSGLNWNIISTTVTNTLNSLHFPNNLTGFVCGNSGLVMKTTNGGLNWNILSLGTVNNLYSIKFSNISNGCAAGTNGARFITLNGGLNWLSQTESASIGLNTVSYSSSNIFYTGGNYSYIAGCDISLLQTYTFSEIFPTKFILYQNYPNPFNPETNIIFNNSEAGFTELNIYSIEGKLLKTIYKGNLHSGVHNFNVNLSDFSSGVYFYKLTFTNMAGIYEDSKKMILIK
jgi:photosystem II stability/assembly factor-like uncharacterized protein